MTKIKTTHVGSLPRSNELSDLLFKKDKQEKIDLDNFDAVVKKDVKKIVKKQIPLFDDTYFDSRYLWNANYLKYKIHTIGVVLRIYMLLNNDKEDLIISLSFLMHLTMFFFEDVKTFIKISPYKYEELGLKFFERSAEYKKKVEAWRPIPFGEMPKF